MRQGAAAAALLLAAGCGSSAPPPAPPVTLSTKNPGANVPQIVDFFRRTCLAAANDNRRFAAIVAASGWPLRKVQTQSSDSPSVWRFDHGQLLQLSMGPMSNCNLSLDSMVAPTPAALRTALRPVAERPGFTAISENDAETGWAWPSSPGYQTVLTITLVPASPGRSYGAGRQAVSLDLSGEPIPDPGGDQE